MAIRAINKTVVLTDVMCLVVIAFYCLCSWKIGFISSAWNTPPSSAGVKNLWSYTSAPPYVLMA
jgi:hypothetical protein